jgi:hypothetical protein
MPMPKKKQYSSSYNPIVKDPRYQAVDNPIFKNYSLLTFDSDYKSYQWKFYEDLHDDMWLVLKNQDSMDYRLNPYQYTELYEAKKAELIKATKKLAKRILTKRQLSVFQMTMKNWTQERMAKRLKCTQSSIHKELYGILSYPSKIKYGGIVKKMKKAMAKSQSIQVLIEELSYLTNERL